MKEHSLTSEPLALLQLGWFDEMFPDGRSDRSKQFDQPDYRALAQRLKHNKHGMKGIGERNLGGFWRPRDFRVRGVTGCRLTTGNGSCAERLVRPPDLCKSAMFTHHRAKGPRCDCGTQHHNR